LKKIRLELKDNSYDIYIGSGILAEAGRLLASITGRQKAMIVSNKKVYPLHGKKLFQSLSKYFDVSVFLMPDGERYKTIDTLKKIYDAAARARLDRKSVIVALGGGVVGDTAGFAAATYMRGIKVMQVPTSLLAMADSSIGGKTGVDLKAGKNLAGAFHQPALVLMDIDTLQTLPKEEFINGMGEVIKHGIIMDAEFFNYIKTNADKILEKDKNTLLSMVERSALCKTKIVSQDEKEVSGLRAILNYGHTIGHAIEAETGYKGIKHGEAVAIGMAAAARIAESMGLCSQDTVNGQIKVLNSFNLIKPLKKLKTGNIIKRLYNDKKVKDGKIIFILTKKIGHAKLNETVPIAIIKAELKRILSEAAQGGIL
jgi:3-dehydroquinate synthase